eukprot:CAMPEP_0116074904 /NCGR_PEP_ID=MMETSP0322-20121206/16297_1 /TAXON_ID=163516 /ORGANISM="Leptocylindrus danicus var. apora, Strain B651" /LENGTH=510 /DNA_ID=CAMNT_0003564821 /DNA_START=138 /DNA_END=1666 /DNA_ORIENTATION=-
MNANYIELFLSPAQKLNFSRYEEKVNNKSLTNKLFYSFYDNILFQVWYAVHLYNSKYPVECTWLVIASLLAFMMLNSVDVLHARNLKQTTALVDLFKYSCDTCSVVFVILLLCYCLGLSGDNSEGNDSYLDGQWYAVQCAQLVVFTKHLSAFHRDAGLRYNVLTGPGDVITGIMGLLTVRATLGLDFLFSIYEHSKLVEKIEWFFINLTKSVELDDFIIPINDVAAEKMNLAAEKVATKGLAAWSKFGLLVSLLMRAVPALLKSSIMRYGNMQLVNEEYTVVDVICDGLFMAVLTSDVTLAKMANRELHPWVVMMSFASTLSYSTILFLVLSYYCAVFIDLSTYLNMPLFSVCVNVYCDGVFDLCHIGHKQLFQRALGYGNRLFVGVCNDEDCSSYKRPPIMTHDERCAEVQNCKSVTKVIPNAPCFGLTKDFIDKHQIHVVAFGQEYKDRYPNPDDDPYYAYPRKIGIAKPMPRHEGLSTSELIKRIVDRVQQQQENDKGYNSLLSKSP